MAKITEETRLNVRECVALGVPAAIIEAAYGVTADEARAIVESEPTKAELAAKAAAKAAADARAGYIAD